MYKTLKQRSGSAPGFSLVEMLAVVVIFAILIMIAAPAFFSIMPSFQLRRAASGTSDLLHRGRMTAFNTKKPTRVAIDCRTSPCELRLYTAVFDNNGTLDSWAELNYSRRQFADSINVTAQNPVTSTPANVYWAVFMPSGKVLSSHEPFNLVLNTEGGFSSGPWEISLNSSNGHVSVNR